MQQRRVRLGDILDDYCPRERRVTNHAVVAMIEDDVKQTRCTTCNADHEYKEAKVPSARRRKSEGILAAVNGDSRPELVADPHHADAVSLSPDDDALAGDPAENIAAEPAVPSEVPALSAAGAAEQGSAYSEAHPEATADSDAAVDADVTDDERESGPEDEWPVHRPLIRAVLPRPEGHVPERKEPEFTMRQGHGQGQGQGGRFDSNRDNRGGQPRSRGHRRGAQGSGQPGQFGGGFGQRQNGHNSQGGERNGNRAPQPGQRSGRPGGGGGQGGPRNGGGRGPKRGPR